MTPCSFSRSLFSWNTSKFSLFSLLVAYYPEFLTISHQYRKIKVIMLLKQECSLTYNTNLLPHCPFLVMFGLGSGCETSCLTEKCLDVCIGGKFQFLISSFTAFYWGLIAGLNAVVIFNCTSKKSSRCLEIIDFFPEIKSSVKYPNESLNCKVIHQ